MQAAPAASRIAAIDALRGAALLAMAMYHFAWDLEFFGYAEPGMTAVGGWKLFARSIASTFLILAGVSLFLAHGGGVRWDGFWKRFAMVAGAASLITVATWFATPETFIFFGILHQIAFASLAGLAFLRLPALLLLALGAVLVAAPFFLRTPLLDAPLWWWTGLSETLPRSNDYVPVFPWFGAVLIGIAAGKIAVAAGATARLRTIRLPGFARWFALAGRHSLAVYLIHQPVLIACLFAFSAAFPPASRSPQALFAQSCEERCGEERDGAFCRRYCACVLASIERENMLDAVFAQEQNDATQARLGSMAEICTREASVPSPGDGSP